MKKKFIDKKKATTFVVLNRGTDGSNVTDKVFQPVKPPNFPRDQHWKPQLTLDDDGSESGEERNERNERRDDEEEDDEQRDFAPVGNFRKDDFALGEYGFPDDGYDYAQHFAPLGGGKWFAASAMGGVTAANRAANVPATQEASLVAPPPKAPDFEAPKVVVVKNRGRLLARDEDEQFADAGSDEEVRRLLDESGDSEEAGDLADDFVVAAMQKGTGADKDDDDGEPSPAQVDKKSSRVRFVDARFADDDDEEDDSFHESDMEDDEDEEEHAAQKQVQGRRGVVQFEERVTGGMVDNWLDHLMEKEYDDEQMGEGPEALNHASSEHRGKVFANDLDDYFTEYLEVKKVPSVTAYRNGEDLDEDEKRKTLLLAERGLDEKEEPVTMLETVVVDAQWDCESILSTYSNVANHPKVIEAPAGKAKPRKQKEEKIAFADAVVEKEETKQAGPELQLPKNKGAARKKEETAEERKLRKQSVKSERKQARAAKKSLQQSYKSEAKTQQKHVNAVPFYAQTVIPMNQ